MTADALTASLDKIRARTVTPVDPSADRLTYATFPPGLKSAMKTAATRNGWTREDWAMQTALLQAAMLAGQYSHHELAAAYAAPPPEIRHEPA